MSKLFGRMPIIPLSYSEKHKAQCKELMIDYETGNIYVVSADDREIIFDITSQIKDKIDKLDGNKIEIEIEGVGIISLQDILNELNSNIENTVQAISIDDTVYIGKENVVDNNSLEVKSRFVQIKGFYEADEFTIPRKNNKGELEWVNGLEFGGGDCIPQNEELDGIMNKVDIIEPSNGKLYLRASKRQMSENISLNCIVELPTILDNYSEIEWYVKTNSFLPIFKFSDNVVWRNIEELVQVSSRSVEPAHFLYTFKTFDRGQTWLAEVFKYNISANKSEYITEEYLTSKYDDKDQTLDKFYTKSDVDNLISKLSNNLIHPDMINYYTIDQIQDRYYNKTSIDGKVYDKDQINGMLSNLNTKVETEYYNKIEIDSKFKI